MMNGDPVVFVREFIDALAREDYGSALARLDMRQRPWTKDEVRALVLKATGGRGVSTTQGIMRSARPRRVALVEASGERVEHRLPVGGKWTEAYVVFSFMRVPWGSYHVILEGIHPPGV